MRVIVPPVIVNKKVCRIVAPTRTHIEVQEWTGEYWLPSDMQWLTVIAAPHASNKVLRRLGVPKSDRVTFHVRPLPNMTEAMLIELAWGNGACPELSGEPSHEPYESLVISPRKKRYPGSKRFRKSAPCDHPHPNATKLNSDVPGDPPADDTQK